MTVAVAAAVDVVAVAASPRCARQKYEDLGRELTIAQEKKWQPVTKLGRLVKAGKINSMEEIYLHSLPIKEYQIVDNFLPKLKDEVMKVRYAHLAWGMCRWNQCIMHGVMSVLRKATEC